MNTTSFEEKYSQAKTWLKSKKLHAAILEDPSDLFYWTGIHLSLGTLLITKRDVKLFVDARYIEACLKKAPMKAALIAKMKLPKGAIGFDSTTTSCERLSTLKKLSKGDVKWKPCPNMGKQRRLIKQNSEIKKIKQACDLACSAMSYVKSLLKVGVSEKEVAQKIELFYLQHEARLSFDPIVAFGANSAMPHYTPGKATLKKGDIALIDMGCKIEGFCSDMTRVFFCDKPPEEILNAYNAVKKALEDAMQLCKPEALISSLDQAAKSAILEKDFSCYQHALGHGVGVEVHELPFVSGKKGLGHLEAGMVITLEPGIYIPGLGGIRLENQVLITPSGHKNLTPFELY